MARGPKHIITEDYNGNYKLYGLEAGCYINVDIASGSAKGDLNGYTLNITANEPEPAKFVDSTIIDDSTNTTVTVGT